MSATLRSSRASRANAGGYTSVEVLIAMTLLAIGAAGVIGMQRVTIQGGEDARRFDMATNIANEWVSRLQKDASFWRTQPDLSQLDTMGFGTTTWLKYIDSCNNKFCTPPMPAGAPEGLSPVPADLDRLAGPFAVQPAAQAERAHARGGPRLLAPPREGPDRQLRGTSSGDDPCDPAFPAFPLRLRGDVAP
jgi:type II secretory pathway pseudopilin PulG